MFRSAAAVVALAGGLLTAGCSSSPEICRALDDGQPPAMAARTAYGDGVGERAHGPELLREAASTVHAGCPGHQDAADALRGFADTMAETRDLLGS